MNRVVWEIDAAMLKCGFEVHGKDDGLNRVSALLRARPSNPLRSPFIDLPVLRHFAVDNPFVVPRLRDEESGAVIHLDHSESIPRALIIGAQGTGKTSALRWIARGAPVLSLADYHPGALPNPVDTKILLLDDVSPQHHKYVADVASRLREARIVLSALAGPAAPAGFRHLMLLPFNEREITSAAEPWFPQIGKKAHRGAQLINRDAQAFVAALKAQPGTRLLAIHPLYLFLLLQVYREGEPLPSRRAELFDLYVTRVLQSEPDPDFAIRALEGIALAIKRGQLAKQDHLARGYGLLQERPSGKIEFVHDLLQDFLAARALRRNPGLAPLLHYVEDADWEQVVLFYAGLGDPTSLVEALLARGNTIMAARAQAEAAGPTALESSLVERLIQRAWDQEDSDAIAGLGALRSNKATDYFAARLKERDPRSRARAARILGQLNSDRAIEYLLPQLRDTDVEVRQQVVAALGASKSERVTEPLLVALRGDSRVGTVDTQLRVAAARALGQVGTEKAVPALIVELQLAEPELRAESINALIQIRSELARKPLRALADSDPRPEVQGAAQQVLKAM